MGFQSAINQTLATAESVTSGVVSEVEAKKKEQAKELEKQKKALEKAQKKKTSDFKNFDEAWASKSVKMLNNEIQGKKQQRDRINARVEAVKRKSVLRDTGPVVPMNID